MSEFRSYLDNRGPVLSQNHELAAYFALPYIPEPSKHPSFQNLFMVREGLFPFCQNWMREVMYL